MASDIAIRELLVGEVISVWCRPAYYRARVEAVAHDWAVARDVDRPERVWLIDKDAQFGREILEEE